MDCKDDNNHNHDDDDDDAYGSEQYLKDTSFRPVGKVYKGAGFPTYYAWDEKGKNHKGFDEPARRYADKVYDGQIFRYCKELDYRLSPHS